MDRKTSNERPSIIQEIVFYDKPNIKTVVPEEILPKAKSVPLGKGDIVLSRVRKSLLCKTSSPDSESSPSENKGQQSETRQIKKASKLGKNKSSAVIEVENQSTHAQNEELHVEKDALSSIDSLNHFINYENPHGDSLESVELTQEASQSKKGPSERKRSLQSDKNVKKSAVSSNEAPKLQKQSREPTKDKESSRKSAKDTKKDNLEEASPFKTPRGRAKKAEKKTQKTTMLNFIRKEAKVDTEPGSSSEKGRDIKEKSVKSAAGGSATKKSAVEEPRNKKNPQKNVKEDDKPDKSQGHAVEDSDIFEKSTELKKAIISSNHTDTKEPRGTPKKAAIGRPRRTYGRESKAIKSENYFSDEDVSFKLSPEKGKNYTELTNVPLINNTEAPAEEDDATNEEIEDLLDETEEQLETIEQVEEELQTIVNNGDGKGTKGSKRGRKQKSSGELVKRVKNEIEEVEVEENSVDHLDVSLSSSNYDTDGDSRTEWEPPEYAEYRQQHIKRQQSKIFPCKFCGSEFQTYYGMRKHRALEHDDLGKDRKESIVLKQEKNVDSDEESRDEWMPQDYADYKMKHKMNKMKRVQWYKCKICCAVFSNYYKLSKHRVEHENKPNPYECKHCDSRFKDVETLMAHIRIHQGKDPYQCKKCEKGFKTKDELFDHMPIHVLKKGPIPLKRFRCDICSKEFSKLCDIERHTRVHTGEKPCECNICHKRFQQSHNLSKHLLTHLHVKPFQCEICNKKFGRVDVLNRHLLTHSMEKPFKCELCNKGFIRHLQLTNHITKMHTSSDKGTVVTRKDRQVEDDLEEVTIEDNTSGEFEENEEYEMEEEDSEEVLAI